MRESLDRWVTVALLSMIIANAVLFWTVRRSIVQGYGDFAAFYTAGTLVLRGESSHLYDARAEWSVQQEFASEVEIRRGPLPYIRLPYEALLFAILAVSKYSTALWIWTALKCILLFLIPYVVMPANAFPFSRWFVSFLALGLFPAVYDLIQGQDAILIAFLFAVAFRQMRNRNDGRAGFVLGLGLFKFHLVVPFLLIAWIAGRRRVASGFCVAASAVIAVSVAMVGWPGLLRYAQYLLSLNRAQGVGVITPHAQINLRGLLALVVGPSPYPGPIHWLLLPAALMAIGYAGWIWRNAGEKRFAESFALALLATILTSYYAYSYDLCLLLVPAIAIVSGWRDYSPLSRLGYVGTGSVVLLLLTPLWWLLILKVHAVCLMAIPLCALAIALAWRLRVSSRELGLVPTVTESRS